MPLLEAPSLNRTTLESVSNVVHREVDSLAACLDAIFEGKILEARKYITVVILSLKQGSTTGIFVSELVERLLKYGALLSSEQFELLVRLVNSAIINEKMAMTILPLAAVFHQVSGCVSVTRNKCTQDTVVLHRFAYNSMMQHD